MNQSGIIKSFICKQCNQKLMSVSSGVSCPRCKRTYPIVNGVLDFVEEQLTGVAGANYKYYEETGDFYESHFAAKEIFNSNSQTRIKKMLKTIAETTKANLLIDLGCGTGNILAIGNSIFEQCIGFDVSYKMLEISRKKGFSVYRANIENIPIDSDSADSVTAFSVLHHLENYEALFSESYRVLKPGGYLYTDNDPNEYPRGILSENLIYKWIKNIYQQLFEGKVKKIKDLKINEDIRKQAEFHHFHTFGFCHEKMVNVLNKIGFSRVDIVTHGNPKNHTKNYFRYCPWHYKMYMILTGIMGLEWRYSLLAPQMMIIAKK